MVSRDQLMEWCREIAAELGIADEHWMLDISPIMGPAMCIASDGLWQPAAWGPGFTCEQLLFLSTAYEGVLLGLSLGSGCFYIHLTKE